MFWAAVSREVATGRPLVREWESVRWKLVVCPCSLVFLVPEVGEAGIFLGGA